MTSSKFWISAGLVAASLMISVSASAMTDAWIGNANSSAKIAGNQINFASGTTQEFALYFTSDYIYNVPDFVVGFDKSTATKYGDIAHVPATGVTGKLSLVSTCAQIASSIDKSVYEGPTIVNLGSGREVANADLGGRVYGFDVAAVKLVPSADSGIQKLCTFTMRSNLAANDFQYLVISVNPAGGNSWTSALLYGTQKDIPQSYSLKCVAVPEPSAILALCSGLAGLVGIIRRRK